MIHVEENVKLLDAKTVESQLHDKLSKTNSMREKLPNYVHHYTTMMT